MAKYYVSRTAERDISEIGDFIARDNPVRALSFVRELRAKISEAAKDPLIYRERIELKPGIRAVLHGSYLVYFRYDGSLVEVLRVWHGARDNTDLFRD